MSESDRYSIQALAGLLKRARAAGVIDMADLWRDEPFLIDRLCRDVRFRGEWERYRRIRGIVHGPGGLVVRAKRRYIDPLVREKGCVSQFDAAFRLRVEAFLSESQDEPMIGV